MPKVLARLRGMAGIARKQSSNRLTEVVGGSNPPITLTTATIICYGMIMIVLIVLKRSNSEYTVESTSMYIVYPKGYSRRVRPKSYILVITRFGRIMSCLFIYQVVNIGFIYKSEDKPGIITMMIIICIIMLILYLIRALPTDVGR